MKYSQTVNQFIQQAKKTMEISKKKWGFENDYHKCYFENTFILSRLKKYILKDYEISINFPNLI